MFKYGQIACGDSGYEMYVFQKSKSNQLHAVSRTQQGRQRELSVNTLRSPLSAEFWRHCHCVLSGGPNRRASASTPERRNENLNVNKYFTSSSGDRTHNQSILQSHFVPMRPDWPLFCTYSIILIFLRESVSFGYRNVIICIVKSEKLNLTVL